MISLFSMSRCHGQARGVRARLWAVDSAWSCRRRCASVVAHVCFDEVTGSQRTAQRQFTGQDTSSDNAGQTTGVVTRIGGMSAAHSEEVEHGCLWLEDSTTTDGADFDTWHRD